MANYLTYPFKTMRITQTYLGKTSHYPHTTGNIKDYPIDEAGKDTGRDAFFCPCDEVVIKKIYGVGTSGTNTIWLSSTSPVVLANGKKSVVTMLLTHPNDSDLYSLKSGQTFKRGELVCYEGTDGATGNHIHLSIGLGEISEGGWSQNSNGKWVLRTTLGTIKPEKAFWINKNFTTIANSNGLKFKTLSDAKAKTIPTAPESTSSYSVGNYKVTATVLNVRTGPGTTYAKKTFYQFTQDAQTRIKKLNNGKIENGYVKGLTFTALEVKGNWGRTPSGWVCLDYCEAIQ